MGLGRIEYQNWIPVADSGFALWSEGQRHEQVAKAVSY